MAVPDPVAVYTAIAALNISGMTSVYTLGNTPDVIMGRYCPALVPDGVSGGSDEFASMGTAGGSFYRVQFTLDYLFLYSEVGQSRATSELLAAAETQLTAVIAAVRNTDTTTAVRIVWSGRGKMGTVEDYSGHKFIGCPISFTVWQLYNN